MAKSDPETVVDALLETCRDGMSNAIDQLGLDDGSSGYEISAPPSANWFAGIRVNPPQVDPAFFVYPLQDSSAPRGSGYPAPRRVDYSLGISILVNGDGQEEEKPWRKLARYRDAILYVLSASPHLGLGTGDHATVVSTSWALERSGVPWHYLALVDVDFVRVRTYS